MDTIENINNQQILEHSENPSLFRKLWCHECKFEFKQLNPNSFECLKCKGYFCEEVIESQDQQDDPRKYVPYGENQPQNSNQQRLQNSSQQNTQNQFRNSTLRNQISNITRNNNASNAQNNVQSQSQYVSPITRLNQLLSSLLPVTSQLAGISDNSSLDNILDFLMRTDTNSYGTPPASENSIESLSKVQYSKDMSEDKLCECSICKDEFSEDEQVIKMPCNHIFHDCCLVHWLKRHNSCPTCRFELPTDCPDYEARKQQRQQRNNQQQPRN